MGSQIAKCHAFSAQVVGFTEVSRATLEPRAWSRGQQKGQVYHILKTPGCSKAG